MEVSIEKNFKYGCMCFFNGYERILRNFRVGLGVPNFKCDISHLRFRGTERVKIMKEMKSVDELMMRYPRELCAFARYKRMTAE